MAKENNYILLCVYVYVSIVTTAYITRPVFYLEVGFFHHDAVYIHDVWESVLLPSILLAFRIDTKK